MEGEGPPIPADAPSSRRGQRLCRLGAFVLLPGIVGFAVASGLFDNPTDPALPGEHTRLAGPALPEIMARAERQERLIDAIAAEPDTQHGEHGMDGVSSVAEPGSAARIDGMHRRSSFDLATYFAQTLGNVRSEALLYHVHLNPTTAPVAPELAARFEDWARSQNRRFAELATNWRQARLAEMVAAADAGIVRPLHVEPPSEADLVSLANQLLRGSSELQAQGYTVETLTAELRKAPPPAMNVGENHMVHQGRVYRSRDFEHLPVSDGMFEAVRFFASESLGMCFAFFEQHGFAPDGTRVREAVERLATVHPRELRERLRAASAR